MASLTNTKIKDTYDGLLKTTDNDALGGTYKVITDGLGNSSGVYLGTGGNVGIGATNPDSLIHVFGNTSGTNVPRIKIEATGWSNDCRIERSSGDDGFYITNNYDTKATSADNSDAGTSGVQMARGFVAIHSGASGAFSERVRVKSNGYVGIGEIDPSKPLTIKKDQSETAIMVQSSDTGLSGIYLGGITDSIKGGLICDNSDNSIQLRGYNNATRLFVKSDGKIGIGTNDPAELLTVSASDDVSIRINSTKNGTWTTNQKLGALEFFGNDSSSSGAGLKGYINLTSENQFGAAFNMNFGVGDNATDRMVITYDGDVGIGTTDPDFKLEVNGTLGLTGYIFHVGDSNSYFGFPANDTIIAATAGTERMRINSSGVVTIGNTSQDPIADRVNGFSAGHNGNGRLKLMQTSTDALLVGRGGSGNVQRFYYNATGSASQVGSISITSSSTSYNVNSDYRLKENVVDMTGALDRVEQLQPKRFNFISDAETTVDGFIAHEVQSVIPEAITGEKDAVDDEGNPEYQGIDQSKIVPLLVGAIKELKAEIEILKSQINS